MTAPAEEEEEKEEEETKSKEVVAAVNSIPLVGFHCLTCRAFFPTKSKLNNHTRTVHRPRGWCTLKHGHNYCWVVYDDFEKSLPFLDDLLRYK